MKYIGSNIGFIFTKIKELMNSHNTSTSAHSELFKSWVILNSPTNAEIVNAIAAIYKKGVGDVLVNENSGDATKLFFRPSIATVEIPVFGEPTETLKETKGIYITTSGEQGQYIASHTDGTLTLTPAASDAVLYTPQTLTEEQQEQARTNIGAGQPVFAVNVTEAVESGGYTADKTAAEIEAAYQAGRTIVCKMQARFVIGYIPVELPLVSRNQGRDFSFAGDQLVQGNWILATTVNISDSRVEVFNNMVEIYEKPASGIPKSDLEQSVQTSLARADTSISYDSQTLTEAQQKQARANIGAGQPVFAVNVTEVGGSGGYTADKTAAEIEAAYQAGRTIVCKTQMLFMNSYISVELPLMSRNQERVFIFAVYQLILGLSIVSITVNISDSKVEVSTNSMDGIYEKPTSGIPKSDLADDVQTSLAKADTAISYDSQTLTDAQKQQARTNIGAVKCSVEGNRLILTT